MLGLYALQQDEQFLGIPCWKAERDDFFEKPSLPRDDGGTISNVSHDHLKFSLTGAHSGRLAVFG
ncbi:hypothetical protein ATY77_09390 [Rhizobium sp. R634]|nr:hypothetical protein ATY77_08140 [Rhizobium sp. R634]OWV73407.1 hypothetical protein ATY77_09390 [Rhizobium sp. R634]